MPAKDVALGLAGSLALHGGLEVVVMDVAVDTGWTDYFVIATATSSTHMRGLFRHLDEEAAGLEATRFNRPSSADDEEWILADYGDVVVHIMTARARDFYELEKLWFRSPRITIADPGLAGSNPVEMPVWLAAGPDMELEPVPDMEPDMELESKSENEEPADES